MKQIDNGDPRGVDVFFLFYFLLKFSGEKREGGGGVDG